ncbi:DEAD/DEAH box helicase family protein [Myxococcota bacterium]|nr:DEAD/DEAH box helicase family protein [Myxococcota bacterium]
MVDPKAPPEHPEQKARRVIDAQLAASGWVVQHKKDVNLAAGPGVAVRELLTGAGPADYALFLGNQLAGVLEAKKVGTTLSDVEAQTRDYAARAPKHLQVPVRPLPFLYESTGEETFFTNGLDPEPRARRVFQFHRPETLAELLDAELRRRKGLPGAPAAPTLKGRMRLAPPLDRAGLWEAQYNAVANLEESFRLGKRRALIQMATGAGKTVTAISAVYRLVKHGGARRVLFLVDRGNLGRQAFKELQAFTTPDDGRKFTELYNAINLGNNVIPPVNKVVITTIQRLYSILRGDESFDEDLDEGSAFDGHGAALFAEPPPVVYNPLLPPDFFDVIVIDECHRSIYSLWRQVLEYFDATLVGLTATPAKHTYAFFEENVVSEYRHEQAVRDGVNVGSSVYEILTEVTRDGGFVVKDAQKVVGKRHRLTRALRWQSLDEDLGYAASQVDRSVVVPAQIRLVLRTLKEKLFTEIFPGRTYIPKTLIFAKSDDHAEDVLRELRELWPLSNEEAVKITYRPERQLGDGKKRSASHKPEEVIQAFRNSFNPRIAVTVDMIATGTDIKPLECIVFMRTVKSRGLFEQMKGRGVRVITDADFRAVTPDAESKTHFVIVDCVQAMRQKKVDPPLDRDRSMPLDRLLEAVRLGNREERVLSTIAARLDRMERQLADAQKQELGKHLKGKTLRELVTALMTKLEDETVEARARAIYELPEGTAPTDPQMDEAEKELVEEAAALFAYDAELCKKLVDIRKSQEITIDTLTVDKLVRAGAVTDADLDEIRAKDTVQGFETFCKEHRDELDALRVLFARPYAKRITRSQLTELIAAIQRPPRQWTSESLWAAYERLEKGRVRGASKGRMMTDLISLARHALGVDADLVSYADQAEARFQSWLAQQSNRGRTFDEEQLTWLRLIRDRIVVDLEVRIDDFDETPFTERGGLGRFYALFGDDYERIVQELNEELVA